MDHFSKTRNTILISIASVLCSFQMGCRQRVAQQTTIDQAVQRELCGVADTLTIGYVVASNAVVLDACNVNVNRSIAWKSAPQQSTMFEYSEPLSPDGIWRLRDQKDALVLASTAGKTFSVPQRLSTLVAEPRWSPDSQFVFFITTEDTRNNRPILGCLDDAYDVHVVSLKLASESVVGRLCAGVPYGSLRWLVRRTG
jgi:hypothetical protein